LKWALNDEEEIGPANALRHAALKGRLHIVAPTLWLYEVTSGLTVATRRQRISRADAEVALRDLVSLGVHFADPFTTDIYGDAMHYGIGGNDAAYLSLARVLGMPLWTGDRRFFETMRSRAQFVRWIGDFRALP
jgi:predicted nucleic acid-binding protein